MIEVGRVRNFCSRKMATSLATSGTAFDVIERRLEVLERHVLGPRSVSSGTATNLSGTRGGPSAPQSGEVVVPQLLEAVKQLGEALDRRDRISPLFRRVKELETFLDPSFGESHGLPAAIKADLVLANEQKILEANSMMQVLERKKQGVLDKDDLLATLDQGGELARLSEVHLDQVGKAQDLSDATLELVEQYNEVVATIMETFVRYDELLRAAENLATDKRT